MEYGLLIGEVAARSGLSRKALRLYEARVILLASRRTPSGYRRYPADVLVKRHGPDDPVLPANTTRLFLVGIPGG